MKITNLNAKFFRNYDHLNLELNKPFNVIISQNGMGKTNLLEMIYYLSYVRSFRNVLDKEIIKKGENHFYLDCHYNDNIGSNKISVNYDTKKTIIFNNNKVKKHSDLLGKLLTVYFGTDDLFIISGPPGIRRKFFDVFFSIIDKKYLLNLIKYQNILKQKNLILKNNSNNNLLSVYNLQLSEIIYYIQNKRNEMIKEIDLLFKEYYNLIGKFSEKVKIIYSPSVNIKINSIDEIFNFLEVNKNKEIESGYSTLGTHRDNYLFLINGIPFIKYASFGQTRLASLIIKLIQAIIYKNIYNKNPILLLDDVILELDKQKQKTFLNFITNYDQIFITVTDKNFIDLINEKNIINQIEIEYGKIR